MTQRWLQELVRRSVVRFWHEARAHDDRGGPCNRLFLRGIRRARKIRMRLGAGFSFAEPFPEKPPGMHRRTYLRMRVAAGESIALHDQP